MFGVGGQALRQSSGFDVIGGLQNHTSSITRCLDERGHDQRIVTAFRPGAPRHEAWGDRAVVHRVGLPVRRMRQLWATPAAVTALRLGRWADVVHAHQGEDIAVLPIAGAVATMRGLPLVITMHCSLTHTLKALDPRSRMLRALGAPLEARVVPRADAILVLSETIRGRLLSAGVDGSLVSVVPLGIDLDRFRPPSLRLPSEPPSIAYVGRLARAKGVDVLLDALAMMGRGDVTLRVIGDGPERAALERRARNLGIAARVDFFGALPPEEVAGLAATRHLLVVPSRYEELGRVNLEGMAMGLPVVATRTGGIPDVVRDGVNGLLVPVEDPRALATAIERVIADGAFASRLTQTGMRLARSHGVDALTDVVERAYEDATARKRGGAVARRVPRRPRRRAGAPSCAREGSRS